MGFVGSQDILCKKCGHFESLTRAPRPDDSCPACGAGVYRRVGPTPDPLAHVGDVLRAIGSLRGVFFIVGVALLASLPHVALWLASAVMITLASLKLAGRTMHIKRGEPIEFPEVSADELFDRSALLPAGMFALLFLALPRLLFSFAFVAPEERDDFWGGESTHAANEPASPGDAESFEWREEDAPPEDPALAAALADVQKKGKRAPVADERTAEATSASALTAKKPSSVRLAFLSCALALFLYAPMALVSYLRAGSTWALFLVPQGLVAIAQDPRGYLRLCAVAVSAFLLAYALDALTYEWPFWVSPLVHVPKSALQLLAWGACGLYVRSRARQFGMPVDADDWVILTRPPALAPTPTAPPRVRPESISLESDDDVPLVQGTVLPPDAPR